MANAREWGEGFGVDDEGEVRPVDDFERDAEPGDADDQERLFDEIADLSDDRFLHVGANAVRSLEVEHHRYPLTVEEVIEERRVKRDRQVQVLERPSAYEELGGGVNSRYDEAPARDEVLQNVIAEYEPWQTDIKEAVERFGVVEFTSHQIANMPDKDRHTYALHFYHLLESIDATRFEYENTGGRADLDMKEFPYLEDRYPGVTWAQLKDYMNTLTWLKRELELTGIPRVVRNELDATAVVTPSGGVKEARGSTRDRIDKEFKAYKAHHRRNPRIQVVQGKAGPKIETVK